MPKKSRKNKAYIVKSDNNNAEDYSLFLKLLNIVYINIKDEDELANYAYIILAILNLFNIINLLYDNYAKPNLNS